MVDLTLSSVLWPLWQFTVNCNCFTAEKLIINVNETKAQEKCVVQWSSGRHVLFSLKADLKLKFFWNKWKSYRVQLAIEKIFTNFWDVQKNWSDKKRFRGLLFLTVDLSPYKYRFYLILAIRLRLKAVFWVPFLLRFRKWFVLVKYEIVVNK